jgi:peptidoglycan hydrolase-like protein with peptidoglycan-binding domain
MLGIGIGAVAAGAFVGFLVNGPPGRTASHRTVADVAPPTPTVPPPTAQDFVGRRTAAAVTVPQPPPEATRPAEPTPATSPSLPAAQPSPPPSSPSSPPVSSPQPLPSNDVREVQGRLRALGFNPGPIDGSAGPLTTAALKQYQQSRGLSDSGVADKDLLATLRREPGSTPPPPPPRARSQYAAAQSSPPPPQRRDPLMDAIERLFRR